MQDGKVYHQGNYFFCRKEMAMRFMSILLILEKNRRKNWGSHIIVADEFCSDSKCKRTVQNLHPTNMSTSKFDHHYADADYNQWWKSEDMDRSFYFGSKNSLIVMGIIHQ